MNTYDVPLTLKRDTGADVTVKGLDSLLSTRDKSIHFQCM